MKASGFTRETISEIGVSDRKFPEFSVGDTIAVSLLVKEGDKERVQIFEGDVLAIKKNGASSTFTVRKIGANSVAVERVLPFYSPLIESIKLVRGGKKRRAKLYYIRERIGKAARIEEEVLTKEQKDLKAQQGVAQEGATKPSVALETKSEELVKTKKPE